MQTTSSFGDPVRDSRDLPDEPHTKKGEKAMNPLVRTVVRFCVVSVFLGRASWALAAPGPGHDHAAMATLANAPGDAILGDGGVYTDGVGGVDARIWDFDPPGTDHFHFQVDKKFTGRSLTLVINELAVNTVCQVGRLKPNESSIGFQFYNDPNFPIGDSTSGLENYGGTLKCTEDRVGKTGWYVHWKPADQCIVIAHPASGVYSFTAQAGCLADVSKIVNGTVKPPLGAYQVPFQVSATEILP